MSKLRKSVGSREQFRVECLFWGDWNRADFGSPFMYPGDRIEVARRAHNIANLWAYPDPRYLAVELELRLCPTLWLPCGGEAANSDEVFFVPTTDRQQCGLGIYHGCAHALLFREGWRHSEADVWWLTGDLAIPGPMLRCHPLEEIEREAYVPPWFARAWHPVADRGSIPLRRRV